MDPQVCYLYYIVDRPSFSRRNLAYRADRYDAISPITFIISQQPNRRSDLTLDIRVYAVNREPELAFSAGDVIGSLVDIQNALTPSTDPSGVFWMKFLVIRVRNLYDKQILEFSKQLARHRV